MLPLKHFRFFHKHSNHSDDNWRTNFFFLWEIKQIALKKGKVAVSKSSKPTRHKDWIKALRSDKQPV